MKHALLFCRLRTAAARRAGGTGYTRTAALLALVLFAALSGARAADPPQFVVKKYDIKVQLFPTTHILDATTRIDFVPQTSISQLSFELNSSLRVQKIVDPAGADVPFQQDGLTLKITLPSPVTERPGFIPHRQLQGRAWNGRREPCRGAEAVLCGP